MTTEERISTFTELCSKMNFELSNELMDWLLNNNFFTAPASTRFHGAYEGGLFDHSLAVANRLIQLSINNKLSWERKQSPFIVGMFHDLCKCDQYIKVEGIETDIEGLTLSTGYHYEYNKKCLIKGHGSKSVILLSHLLQLTEEEMLCIRYHMGPYEKEEWEEYDTAIHKFENVLWTHHADMLASKVDDI